MCVIALTPPGVDLTLAQAEAMWKTNNDGAGFAWEDRHGRWRIKTFMEFQPFWNAYKGTVQGHRDKQFLVHFRIGTHGSKTIENVHPFRVNHNTVMAHNGVVSCVPNYNDGRSDTRIFVEDTLPKLPELWLDAPELRWMVEEAIGHSKMVFLTNDPRLSVDTYILNKGSGKEINDGIWVSNTLWERNLPDYKPVYANNVKPFKTGKTSFVSNADLIDGFMLEDANDGAFGSGNWRPASHYTEIWRPDNQLPGMARTVSKGVPADTVFQDKAAIERARKDTGYGQFVALINGSWTCYGCWSDLDDDLDCRCYDSVCMNCYDWAGDCVCGMDMKDIVDTQDILDNIHQYTAAMPYLAALHADFEWAIEHAAEDAECAEVAE